MKRKRIDSGSKYLKMPRKELVELPEFDIDGMCFYRVGRQLLAKGALVRWYDEFHFGLKQSSQICDKKKKK